MCRGGTGFASDISAGLEVQFLSECPAPPHPALPCHALPLCSALAGCSTQPACSHVAQVAASIERKTLTISLFWSVPLFPVQIPNFKLHNFDCADEGGIGSGVRRDWLNSMMASMLDPQTGLFESADGGHTWQPCPLAHFQDQHVVYFEMLGRHPSVATCCHLWSQLQCLGEVSHVHHQLHARLQKQADLQKRFGVPWKVV